MSKFGFLALSLLVSSPLALARERWLERDDKPVFLHPRRFGQENPEVINKLREACPGEVCATLAGAAITPLLAAQPECSQQDMADDIIDAAAQFDAATQENLIAIAIEYRQAEKNTPPDFTTDPPTARNSVFCQQAPRNAQLNGLVQAQDPANDPNVFFDPALAASVQLGSQANTSPFGSDGAVEPPADEAEEAPADDAGEAPADGAEDVPATETAATETADATAVIPPDVLIAEPCVATVTVTVTGDASATATDAVTVSVGTPSEAPAATETAVDDGASATVTSAAPEATETGSDNTGGSAIGDFGSCTIPEIEFGVGFDNRRETSFRPADLDSFNHGSAQNINIITQFICDELVNSCGADQAAQDTCADAEVAAAAATAGTGGAADAFNAVFGITTDFASVASVDNQGNVVPGTGDAEPAATTAATTTAAAATTTAAAATTTAVEEPEATEAPAVTTTSEAAAETSAAADDGDNDDTGDADAGNAAGNLQSFAGTLGGVAAPAVADIGNGQFEVQGNDQFNNLENAVVRSCDVQNNQCANAANASGNRGDLTVANCNAQQAECIAQARS